jgi:hypothetical protein
MPVLLRTSLLPLLLVAAGCAGGRASTSPDPSPVVRIENRSSSDVDIYLLPALTSATRVGFVPASDTVEFALARAQLSGSPSFRLEARPIRGGSRMVSEPFNLRSGEEFFWSISP